MKRIILSFLFVIILLFMFGCDNYADNEGTVVSPSSDQTARQVLADYVKTLCSEEFEGRLPGSVGNDLTVEWLSENLQAIGIEPYQNSDYRMGFEMNCLDNELSAITVYEADGDVRELVWGRDFFFSLTSSFDIYLTQDDYLLVREDTLKSDERYNYGETQEGSSYIFHEVSEFTAMSYSASAFGVRDPLWIELSLETFEYLYLTDIDKIHISNTTHVNNKEIYNVVGRIAGSDSSKAVILTAHFDHLGAYGETFFPGALDNASGTATLLHIAELLQKVSETSSFSHDIIIAFCNAEEQYMIGSFAIASVLYGVYESLMTINIDCVGPANVEIVYPLGGGNNQSLINDLKIVMDKHGILYNDDAMFTADHSSFENYSIPSVGLIYAGTYEIEHTENDTPDTIDYEHLATFSDMIVDYIRANGAKVYQSNKNADQSQAQKTPREKLPDDIMKKFEDVIKKVKDGEEVGFDDDLVVHMNNGKQDMFSYSDYLENDINIAILKEFGDYHLRIINENFVSGTLALSDLIYMKDRSDENAEPETIYITPRKEALSGDIFERTPIDGLNGYYALYNPQTRSFVGFAYETGDYTFDVLIVRTVPQAKVVRLGFFFSDLSLEEVKAAITDTNIEEFEMMWKEY